MTGCKPPEIVAAFHGFGQDATVERACVAGAWLNTNNTVDAHPRFDHINSERRRAAVLGGSRYGR